MTLDLTQWLTTRNRNLTRAGEGIIKARKVIDQLEEFLVQGSSGKVIDAGDLVNAVHQLKGHVDDILVGLVESSCSHVSGEFDQKRNPFGREL